MADPAKIHFMGNHNVGGVGHTRISASETMPVGFGYMVARGAAGAEGITRTEGLQLIMGRYNMGLFLQADVPVEAWFTLSPDPMADDAVWGNKMTISDSEIHSFIGVCVGIKLKFGASAGTVCIGTY